MRSSPRHFPLRAALSGLLLLTGFGLVGCGSGSRSAATSGKDGPSAPAAARRQSEYDYYCSLRPAAASPGSLAGPRPFAPAVYESMKSHGYQVHMVRYRYVRPASPFASYGGYGFRDFFGTSLEDDGAGRTVQGQRAAVVWETRGGEFYLVDHYYANPMWLEGTTWMDKVRFYDPAAVSVEVDKS